MHYRIFTQTALYLALAAPVSLQAELPGLTVRVTHLPTTSGTVEVSLFDSAESFLKEPYLQRSGKVDANGEFEAVFIALPAGDYAVVAVHDANDNGKLDTGFLGFGAESYGYSNNVHPWFGRPGFDDTKIRLGDDSVVVEIDMD